MAHPQFLLRTKTDPGSPDTVPTTALTLTAWTQIEPYTHVMVTFQQATNAAPLAQLADNTTLVDVTIATQELASPGGTTCMTVQTPLAGVRLRAPVEVVLPVGATMGVYLSALSSPNASTERVNIQLKPFRK
jgi:hypothetical protein